MQVLKEKKILVAALDWGIGHATRCVPIIRRLQNQGYEIILASNGNANKFFKDYFPELLVLDKPAYNITYPINQSMAKTIFSQLPSIIKSIISEHLWLKKIIREYKIDKVVSDNCYGLWNKKIHSVFITHQLFVKCPVKLKFLEPLIHFIVSYFINKYDECYIPDLSGKINFSGTLSHQKKIPSNARFIGILSRFSENKSELISKNYDVSILISGPEPQRTIFENKCLNLLQGQMKKCCIIRGLPGSKEKKNDSENITWYNHLSDNELKAVLRYSKKVVCRPGYSTIMDLVELNVKAMLVPTPGQTEQEYLALHNKENELFEIIEQDKMTLKDLIMEVNQPLIQQIEKIY